MKVVHEVQETKQKKEKKVQKGAAKKYYGAASLGMVTLKLCISKYKIRYNFMGSTLIFHFLYVNVLNYCSFRTECSSFFK